MTTMLRLLGCCASQPMVVSSACLFTTYKGMRAKKPAASSAAIAILKTFTVGFLWCRGCCGFKHELGLGIDALSNHGGDHGFEFVLEALHLGLGISQQCQSAPCGDVFIRGVVAPFAWGDRGIDRSRLFAVAPAGRKELLSIDLDQRFCERLNVVKELGPV